MSLTRLTHGTTAAIRPQGRFDFSVHRAFRDAVKAALAEVAVRVIEVDLSAVDYMDSSALGMLLLSRENAMAVNKSLVLARPSAGVRQILDVANFQKLFEIR